MKLCVTAIYEPTIYLNVVSSIDYYQLLRLHIFVLTLYLCFVLIDKGVFFFEVGSGHDHRFRSIISRPRFIHTIVSFMPPPTLPFSPRHVIVSVLHLARQLLAEALYKTWPWTLHPAHTLYILCSRMDHQTF